MNTLTRPGNATLIWGLTLISLAFLFPPVAAQETATGLRIVALNLTAQEEGRATPEGADAPASRPGDLIEYRLSFTNTREGAVGNVVFDDPIPVGLVYVEGSAGAEPENVVVEFSIDGGDSYTANPEIEVEEAGERVRRPAPAEAYTHVRWTVQGTLAPGEEVRAVFRVRVSAGIARTQ